MITAQEAREKILSGVERAEEIITIEEEIFESIEKDRFCVEYTGRLDKRQIMYLREQGYLVEEWVNVETNEVRNFTISW